MRRIVLYITIVLCLALVLFLCSDASAQNQSVLVTPKVQLEAQVMDNMVQPESQVARQTIDPRQQYMQAQMQYNLWFNAHYRPVRGPVRRLFVGPFVRRAPWDQQYWMYHYYMRR